MLISIMSGFLLLVLASVWTRISCSALILEPSVLSLASSDSSNPFDAGLSTADSKLAASSDTETKLVANNGELTPSYDCLPYNNAPFKARVRVRQLCKASNLRTTPQPAPEGDRKTQPEAHGGGDPHGSSEENDGSPSEPSGAKMPEEEEPSSRAPTNLQTQNPWDECKKHLRGMLKYAVCDDPDPAYSFYRPLPLVYPNAPFWTLLHCTLGKAHPPTPPFGKIPADVWAARKNRKVFPLPELGLYICPSPGSQAWCCWDYDVAHNVGVAVGCLTLYYLQLAGDVFP